MRPDSESASKVNSVQKVSPLTADLDYMLARDARIGLNYLKMFKINSLLFMKFY
jgi:hypothetical protein